MAEPACFAGVPKAEEPNAGAGDGAGAEGVGTGADAVGWAEGAVAAEVCGSAVALTIPLYAPPSSYRTSKQTINPSWL